MIRPDTLALGLWAFLGWKIYDGFFGSDAVLDDGDLSQAQAQAQAQGQSLSFAPIQYSIFADTIYESLKYSAVADDKDGAERVLLQMNNTLDVLELIRQYGRRQHYIFGIPEGNKRSLPETIQSEFFGWRITRLNNSYQSKGINIRF